MTLAAVAVAFATVWFEPADPGHSLDDEWNAAWRRLLDRSGRPDPLGPAQQRLAGDLYPEYALDLAALRYPTATERAWAGTERGARLWVHSLDEFDLADDAQLKARAPVGRGGWVGLRLDRHQTRTARSDLLAVDFGLDRIAGTGGYAAIRMYPRFEKDDSDVVATAGWLHRLGEARLRVFALDPFTNASFALARSRGARLREQVEQEDPPLGFAIEAATARFAGVRAEAYAGTVLDHGTAHRFAGEPERDHRRDRSARLGGALVEWRPLPLPLRAGAAALAFDTRDAWIHGDARDAVVRERTRRLLGYLLAAPWRGLEVEVAAERTSRPETRAGEGASARRDIEYLSWLRAMWTPARRIGADLGVMRVDRVADPADPRVEGVEHRLLTRMILRLGDRVWATFGVGWDLDPGDGSYDGGGTTMLIDF